MLFVWLLGRFAAIPLREIKNIYKSDSVLSVFFYAVRFNFDLTEMQEVEIDISIASAVCMVNRSHAPHPIHAGNQNPVNRRNGITRLFALPLICLP